MQSQLVTGAGKTLTWNADYTCRDENGRSFGYVRQLQRTYEPTYTTIRSLHPQRGSVLARSRKSPTHRPTNPPTQATHRPTGPPTHRPTHCAPPNAIRSEPTVAVTDGEPSASINRSWGEGGRGDGDPQVHGVQCNDANGAEGRVRWVLSLRPTLPTHSSIQSASHLPTHSPNRLTTPLTPTQMQL